MPNWFDRYAPRRVPAADVTNNVLQIYPSETFIQSLPGGRIPTRDDFKMFADDPDERIRRWREVVAASERLGEQFVEDREAGQIPNLIESF